MKYQGVCIAVKNVSLSKKFYQDLFGLEVFQDYGINISFGGLSLQQNFDKLLGIPKEKQASVIESIEVLLKAIQSSGFKNNTRDTEII